MPTMETKFTIPLTNDDRIFVEFGTERGRVESFIVKLICDIHSHSYEVIRYDGAHGSPHKDVLDLAGHVARKVWYHYLSNEQALTMAIDDINDNYESYRERFKQWLRIN